MSSIASSAVSIQTSPQSVPSTPSWFVEVAIIVHHLTGLGLLDAIAQQVRFARHRFGRYETIDFVAVLIGYALSGEATLETFYDRLRPFAPAFMALFERNRLPHRSTLSRFLATIDQPTVEAFRALFQQDLLARPLTEGAMGIREGCGTAVENAGTSLMSMEQGPPARQRALPHTPDLPAPSRRLNAVCAPGYLGRKRGEVVRTRTTVLQAHTSQWMGTFGEKGNGD